MQKRARFPERKILLNFKSLRDEKRKNSKSDPAGHVHDAELMFQIRNISSEN